MAFGETWTDHGAVDPDETPRCKACGCVADTTYCPARGGAHDHSPALDPGPWGFIQEGDLAEFHSIRGIKVPCRVTGAQSKTYRYGHTGPWSHADVEIQVTGRKCGRYGYHHGEHMRVTPLFLFPRRK